MTLGTPMMLHRTGRQEGALDPITARQLHDIQQKKAAAVAREDYDEAKRLKQVMLHRICTSAGACPHLAYRVAPRAIFKAPPDHL